MLECVPHWQILGGLIIAVCGGFWLGQKISCHKSYGKGKRETEIKYLKKIAAIEAEQFKKPVGPHGAELKD